VTDLERLIGQAYDEHERGSGYVVDASEAVAAAKRRELENGQPDLPNELRAIVARDLCKLPDPPASDELLGPLVVRGQRLVLGAHTGEGKTTMALQLVRAIVDGEEFLDWRGPGKAQALVVDAEQGLRTIKRRLHEAGLHNSERVHYVRAPDGLALDSDTDDVAAIDRILASVGYGGYAIVVFDPLYKLHRGDSIAERAAVDLMRLFDTWRERYGFALLLPVHLRKPIPGERFSIHDVFGSSAYVRGAEVVLGLRRVSNGYAELHFFKDRDGDLEVGAKWGLLFDHELGFRRAPDGPEEDEAAMVERLLEHVRQNPGQSTKKVTDAIQGRKATLTRILRSNNRFRSERRGQADLWFDAEAGSLFPVDGNRVEQVVPAKDVQPVPEGGFTPIGGNPTGTGASAGGPAVVPDEEEPPA
jgi:hypothetical protein